MKLYKKNRRAAALLLSILFTMPPSVSQAIVELPEEHVIASVIYDESEDRYLSPGMVTVIRPEEWAGEQRTLPDLLDNVPGLRVIRLGGRFGYSVASVRGSSSSQVAVYVNGVLMNLQSEAAVDLSAIPMGAVERIEVYRGFIPARFGAQAMGGVINIVTKSPDEPQTSVSLGLGSFGRYKATVLHSGRLGGGSFLGLFGYETYDGDFRYWNDNATPFNVSEHYTARRQNNSSENMDMLLKWEDGHWQAAASFVRRNRELPSVAPGMDRPGEPAPPGATLDTARWDLSLARRQSSGALNWNWRAVYTGQNKEFINRRAGAASSIGGLNIAHSEYDTTRFGLALDASLPIGERHFLELFAGYSRERLGVRGDMIFEYFGGIDRYDSTEWSFNIQNTMALDRAGMFLFTPSVRWHRLDDESRATWQAALTKELSPNWMIKGTYGTYARAPNMHERFGDGAFILPPSDNLRWETGTQLDVGVIWNGTVEPLGGAHANASLSGFMRRTDDLIEFFMENPRFARFHNIASAEVKGVEMEGRLDWERWALSFSATWMDAINRTPDTRFYGMKLPNRPEWSATARLTRRFGRGSVFAEYQYIGENYADASQRVAFESRNVWNLGFRYDLSPTTRITAGVNDVFNSAYDWRMRPAGGIGGPSRMLWHPVEGRSLYLTLSMTF